MTAIQTESEAGQRNVALVHKLYELFNTGELQKIKDEIFTADIEWVLPGRNPVGGVMHGPDEVIAFFGGLFRNGVKVEFIKVGPWGADTVVEVHHGYGTARGASLDVQNCTHYMFRNGRIARVQVYMSDQYSVDDFFWAAYDLVPLPIRCV